MENRKHASVTVCVSACVFVVAFYVLSVGPVVGLVDRGYISAEWVDTVLLPWIPLDWVYEAGPENVRRGLDWYIGLWETSRVPAASF